MKRLLLLLLAFPAFTYSVFAQRGFEIGATVVPSSVFIVKQNNYETLDGCPAISRSELDYNPKWGYTVGGSVGFNFNKRVGLLSGVRYVRTGQNYEDTFNPGAQFCQTPYHVVREVDLRYLRVPLSVRYRVPFRNPDFKFYASAGLYAGWLLQATETVVVNDMNRTNLTPTKEKFDAVDMGLNVGIGAEYFITKSLFLSLGIASDFGLLDMNGPAIKDLEWFSKNDVGYKKSRNFNAGLSIGMHYIFNPGSQNPFKKKGDNGGAPVLEQ